MDARAITSALGGKWQGRYGLCCCPSHADSTPSLKISDSDTKGIDVHCFAGCEWKKIKSELRRQGLLDDNFSADVLLPTLCLIAATANQLSRSHRP
jgi:hypothetical protein